MNDLRRVAVGLSGGVDSAVAAALLVEAGHEVTGLTMKTWSGRLPLVEGGGHACYGPGEESDVAACEATCERLGIPYRTVDLAAEYEERVVGYFRSEYLAGRTPNPCVRCNAELKFGFLVERARASGLDFDAFATGHYARTVRRNGAVLLRTAAFAQKDQTYFIWRLESALLENVIFPLGELDKEAVRATARRLGLEVADKPESQDFVSGDYAPLFEGLPVGPGDIVDEAGAVLGRHRGIVHYTIGQRRGLMQSLGPEPRYVMSIDAERNRVVVSSDQRLFAEGLEGRELLVHDPALRGKSFDCLVRIRQNHKPAPARVEPSGGDFVRVLFETPQRAVAPGQSAVFYDTDGVLVGGAVIERPLRAADLGRGAEA
ncbi:MAG TPA: tRNA 2-thiouridine(34) synthase MnmA [Spirochaetales bacterium]|nr:tRNA 2-thiouridine(34) synthase MnmA [Spirochaetales bacterium]